MGRIRELSRSVNELNGVAERPALVRRQRYILGLLGLLLLINLVLGISVSRDRMALYSAARSAAPSTADEAEIVARLTTFVRDDIHHCNRAEVETLSALVRWNYLYNPFGVGPKTIVDYGGDFRGACGSCSRVLLELLSVFEIPSRYVILLDDDLDSRHTLLEVFYSGAWGAVDPLYGIIYKHPDGRPADVRTLRKNEELFRANAKEGWEYGYGPARRDIKHPYNMDKYAFRNAQYFNYGKFGAVSRGLFRVLQRLFGEEATLWLRRPNTYTYPAALTAILLDVGAAMLVLGWLMVRFAMRRRAAPRVSTPAS